MTPTDVSKITGYARATVHDWCSSGKLHHFCLRKSYLVPKLSLIDLMMSDDFKDIKVKLNDYTDFRVAFYRKEDTTIKFCLHCLQVHIF